MTRARAILSLALTSLAIGGCQVDVVTPAVAAPELLAIDPAQGPADAAQAVTLRGRNLLPKIVQDLSVPEGVRVDASFSAWLGDVALDEVRYIDDEHLGAVVPAGLAAGRHDLRVETPHGLTAELAEAYTVRSETAPQLSAVDPSDLVNDAATSLQISGSELVAGLSAEISPNGGSATALTVLDVTSTSVVAEAPAALTPGTYDLRVVNPGGLDASLIDAVRVWAPAALTVEVAASGTVINTGATVDVVVTVRNGGGSGATGVTVASPTVSGSGTASHVSGPSPASADIAAGASQDFVFRFRGETAGEVVFSAGASGSNAFSGRPVSAATASSAPVSIQLGAALEATVQAPIAVSIDQQFGVELTVRNSGQGDATGVSPAVVVSGSGTLTLDSGPAQTSVDLAGGASQVFTYTYTATALGTVTLDFTIDGTDVSNATAIQTNASTGAISIQQQPSLSAVWIGASATVLHGASFDVVLQVVNNGGATAQGTAPTALTVTGTTGTSCGGPSPASVDLDVSVAQDFTFSCTAGSSSGSFTLQAGAQGSDANSGDPVTALPIASPAFAVVGPATVTLSWATPPTQLSSGQSFTATLTASNSGESGVTALTPDAVTVTGSTGTSCGAPTPASASLASSASRDFVFTCTAGASSGNGTLEAAAQGQSAIDGSAVSAAAATSASFAVLQAADLVIDSVTGSASNVSQGEAGLTVTVVLSNPGEVDASVSSAAGWLQFFSGASDVSGEYSVGPAGGNPTTVTAGSNASFDFTVGVGLAATTGAIVLDAQVDGTDALSGAAIGASGASVPGGWTVAANTPPVACFTLPTLAVDHVVEAGTAFDLDASCSSDAQDPDSALRVSWDYNGDGTFDAGPSATLTGSHSYSSPGIYTLIARITDSVGAVAFTSTTVVVAAAGSVLVVDDHDGNTGAQTLAQAIAAANANANPNTIRFDPTAFAGGQTITLGASLTASETVHIVGHPDLTLAIGRYTLQLQGTGSTVSGLQVTGSAGGQSTPCLVIASAASGTQIRDSNISACDVGIEVAAADVVLGPNNALTSNDDLAVDLQTGAARARLVDSRYRACGSIACVRIANGINDVVVQGNTMWSSGARGISAGSGNNLRVFHNTLHNISGNALSFGGTGHQIKNNIFSDMGDDPICDNSGNVAAADNDYNDLFNNNVRGSCTAPAAGTHNLTVDPRYLDAAGGVFTLDANSGCRDAGTDLGLDRNGLRPLLFDGTAPDLGAVESP